MKIRLYILTTIIAALTLYGCEGVTITFFPDEDSAPSDSTALPDTPQNPDTLQNPGTHVPEVGKEYLNDPGIAYVWDEGFIPEITVKVSEAEWNRLLAAYDKDSRTVEYIHADFVYRKGNRVTEIKDGGLRLRGNTSRRRPEGNGGEMHSSKDPDWHHCHFGINFRKFHKDDEHTISGIRKLNLKWFKDDPCYVRELYCYDLFRRYGIWTGVFSTYCRLWIHIEGDPEAAYYGIYNMIEPIDEEYVERRVEGMFLNDKGFLWKCGHNGSMADLDGLDGDFNWDQDNGVNYTYEFKGKEQDYQTAYAQFKDFLLKLKGKGEESFYKWIKEVCDVELLLKTYAVNVAVGMWDDHWNNGNNFYLYFNSDHVTDFKFFFIPYDYDNALGTSNSIDPGKQNPYEWGNAGLLMKRMMRFEEFRKIYRDALKELADPEKGLLHADASIPRILQWQEKIRQYIENDTGEDMEIRDEPGYWGNYGHYRLMERGHDNFFQAKADAINKMN